MSFGSKLEDLPVVPPGGEITATLHATVFYEGYEQEGTIYVEEATGLRLLKVKVQCGAPEPAP